MEDMYANLRKIAIQLGHIAEEHKGQAIKCLDLTELSAWTDFFVIVTVSSSTHRSALQKYLCEYARDQGLEIRNSGKKTPNDDEWTLVDFGPIVVHLMSAEARAFYELERLWANGSAI